MADQIIAANPAQPQAFANKGEAQQWLLDNIKHQQVLTRFLGLIQAATPAGSNDKTVSEVFSADQINAFMQEALHEHRMPEARFREINALEQEQVDALRKAAYRMFGVTEAGLRYLESLHPEEEDGDDIG